MAISDLKNKTNYFFIYSLLFICARSTVFTFNVFQGPLLLTIISMIVFFKRGFSLSNKYLMLIAIILGYFAIIFIQFNQINVTYSLNIILRSSCAWFIFTAIGNTVFEYFYKAVAKLAAISLIFFSVQLLIPELLFSLFKGFNNLFPWFFLSGESLATIVVFTVKSEALYRNSGFMWEPGAFAGMLVLAILFGLVATKFKLTRAIYILTIALITTLSTMGFLVILVISFFFILNTIKKQIKPIYIIVLIFVFVPLVYFLLSQDFVVKELVDEINNSDEIISNATNSTDSEFMSLGRIGSFKMDVFDLLKYPVFGHGGNLNLLTQFAAFKVVNRTNGVSGYLVSFGIVGFVFLIRNLNKSFKKYATENNIKGTWLIVLSILLISFSNPWLDAILFLGLQFYYLMNVNIKKNSNKLQNPKY